MIHNVKLTIELFEVLKPYPDRLKVIADSQRIDNENFDPDNLGIFNLTEVELQDTPKEFQSFIRDNKLLVKSTLKFNQTESYSNFLLNLNNLKSFLNFSERSFDIYFSIIEGTPEWLFNELGYGKEEHDYDSAFNDFKSKFSFSRDKLLYETSLVNLLAMFEAFMSDILKWIYKNDVEIIKNKKAMLSIDDILNNYNSFVSVFISEYVDNIKNWNDRRNEFRKPLNIDLDILPSHKIIQEAIDRRNLYIHHGGRVNKKYYNTYKTQNIGEKLVVDSVYYYKVQNAVEEIAKLIEEKVINKYHNK